MPLCGSEGYRNKIKFEILSDLMSTERNSHVTLYIGRNLFVLLNKFPSLTIL